MFSKIADSGLNGIPIGLCIHIFSSMSCAIPTLAT